MNKHTKFPALPDGEETMRLVIPKSTLSPAEPNDGHTTPEDHLRGAVDADPANHLMHTIAGLQDRPPSAGDGGDRSASRLATSRAMLRNDLNSDASESRHLSGQVPNGAHETFVGSDQPSGGQSQIVSHRGGAVAGDDGAHKDGAIHMSVSPVIAEIIQLWRMRQRWHRAEKSLILQGKAICRSYLAVDDLHDDNEKVRTKAQNAVKAAANKLFDSARDGKDVDPAVHAALMPFLMSIGETFEPQRAALERRLKKLARRLPVFPWAKGVYGFGELSLAAIVGEAGDLGGYSNPAKLWKRMGLAVINGERQRKKSDIEEAAAHGYRPARRSVMWNIGGGLIGGMGHGPRPRVGEDVDLRDDLSVYQKTFIRFVREEVTKVSPTWNGPDHARDPVERKGAIFESYSSHAANRAKRRVEKRFLVDLLIAWRAAGHTVGENQRISAGSPTSSGSDAGAADHFTCDLQLAPVCSEPSSGDRK